MESDQITQEQNNLLLSLLSAFTDIENSGHMTSNIFAELTHHIFQEYMLSNDFQPGLSYTIQWTDNSEEVGDIRYELTFEPHEILMNDKRIGIREKTGHLPKYRKIRLGDNILEQQCPICFEDYIVGQYKRTLPTCNHTFHKKCVDRWFSKNPSLHCPMCRQNYDRPPEENESDSLAIHSDDKRDEHLEEIPDQDVAPDQSLDVLY